MTFECLKYGLSVIYFLSLTISLPTYFTTKKQDMYVNLLLVQNCCDDESREPIRFHNVWIKNLARLLSMQCSRHGHKKHFCNCCLRYFNSNDLLEKHNVVCEKFHHHSKHNFCDRCLNCFISTEALKTHYENCSKINSCRIKMPDLDKNIIKFKKFKNIEQVLFIVYADLESILNPD